MAKDILRVHATIWPALLLGADYELPRALFVHGYFTIGGQKMSKSLGNVISPIYLANTYGADSVRYYLMRNLPFGSDGDVSEKGLVERHNSELADKFGNLVSRVSTLAEKYGVEKTKNSLLGELKLREIEKQMQNYEIDRALSDIFAFIDKTNEYIQSKKPWETQDKKVLYELVDSIKIASILLSPFIPETSEKIAKHFGFELKYENLDKTLDYKNLRKADILFKKIEFKEKKEIQEKVNKPKEAKKIEGIKNMADLVKYDEFAKMNLRVGTIKNAEDVEGADKLLKLTVDIGEKASRTILAGLKKYYKKEELKGKQVIVIANLEPRKMRGMESQGMLLAAVSEDESSVVLLSPEKKSGNGWKVM
jgi:methionyl-tRNA synthetase